MIGDILGIRRYLDFGDILDIQFSFCCFMSQVNSYGHGLTVSSPNHTFFVGKLELAVNQYFVHILSLLTGNNPS